MTNDVISTTPTPALTETASEIQVLTHPEFGKVRTITENGEFLFCGSDIAKALGYKRPSEAVSAHCEYAVKRRIPHPQAPSKTIVMSFISGSDVYHLIVRSKLPGAKRFQDWLDAEIYSKVQKIVNDSPIQAEKGFSNAIQLFSGTL